MEFTKFVLTSNGQITFDATTQPSIVPIFSLLHSNCIRTGWHEIPGTVSAANKKIIRTDQD